MRNWDLQPVLGQGKRFRDYEKALQDHHLLAALLGAAAFLAAMIFEDAVSYAATGVEIRSSAGTQFGDF